MRIQLKRGAALIGRWTRKPSSGIRVLGYHCIGGSSGLQLDIPTRAFQAQLEELRARGPVVSLSDAIESGRETDQLSAAVLTFDDGFADTFANGVPMFRRLGTPAHFYLATADIRRGWIPTSAGRAEAIRPSALRELAKDPLFTFGSHGHSHRVLLRLSDDEIRDELSTSKALVEEWTGRPALHFAYPKGLWDERVEAIVRTFFRSAVIGGSLPLGPATHPYRIPRYPIQASDDSYAFRAKLDGALFLEETARSMRDRFLFVTGRMPER